MLGRVRASTMSSLESLEMERSSPKIIKHDSFSIYETTLLKLKHGSKLSSSISVEDSDRMDVCGTMTNNLSEEDAMKSDSDCSSTDSKEQRSRNMSIADLFSKYKKQKDSGHCI